MAFGLNIVLYKLVQYELHHLYLPQSLLLSSEVNENCDF